MFLLLKAVTAKQVWIDGYTKANGRYIDGHHATVHVADDHDDAKVASGQGTYSQKKAHAKLSKQAHYNSLPVAHQAALVMEHGYQIQKAETDASKALKFKQKVIKGEKPADNEIAAFLALPDDKRATLSMAIVAAGNEAVDVAAKYLDAYKASHPAAATQAQAPVSVPKPVAETIPEPQPEPEATKVEHDQPADDIDHAALLAEMAATPKGNYKSEAHKILSKTPEWDGWSVKQKHDAVFKLYKELQAAATSKSAVGKLKSKLKAGLSPSVSELTAFLAQSMEKKLADLKEVEVSGVEKEKIDALMLATYEKKSQKEGAPEAPKEQKIIFTKPVAPEPVAEVAVKESQNTNEVVDPEKSAAAGDWKTDSHTHTKTGAVIPKVAIPGGIGKLPTDEYKAIAAKAKKHGGSWSKIGKGFLFNDEAGAQAFVSEMSGHPAPAASQEAKDNAKAFFQKVDTVVIGGVEYLSDGVYLKQYAQKTQAEAKVSKLKDKGYHAAVSASYPFKVLIMGKPGDPAEVPKVAPEVAPEAKKEPAIKKAPVGSESKFAETTYTKKDDGNWYAKDNDYPTAKNGNIAAALEITNGGTPDDVWYEKSGTHKEVVLDFVDSMGGDVGNALSVVYKNGPQEGDTKVVNGITYVLESGRWHKQNKDVAAPVEAAAPDPVAGKPKKISAEEKLAAQKSAVEAIPIPDFMGQDPASMSKFYGPLAEKIKAAVLADGLSGFKKLVTAGSDGTFSSKKSAAGFKTNKCSQTSTNIRQKMFWQFCSDIKGALDANKAPAKKAEKKIIFPKPASESIEVTPIKTEGKAFVSVIDGWEKTGEQKGSNPGGKFKDKTGQEWYCKFPSDPDTVKNEILAAKFYQMLGIAGPNVKMVEKDGKLGIASKWIDGIKKGSDSELAEAGGAHSGFIADAWLANWDVVGLANDNLMLSSGGRAVRVDVGGSLLFRAQGGPKGEAFGNTVSELDTLLDPGKNSKSHSVFGSISQESKELGAKQLAKMHPNQIKTMCRLFAPGPRRDQDALADKLTARRADILNKLGVQDPWNVPPPDITKLVVDQENLPSPIDFSNYPGKSGGLSSHDAINKQNTIDDAALIKFAKRGNLKALQDYQYDAFEKGSGKPLGKKPINEHPNKDIKAHWASMCELLTAIAHPIVDGLDLPPFVGGSADEISQMAGYIKPGENINTISSEKVLGFWMKLGHVGADSVADLIPAKKWYFTKQMMDKAQSWYSKIKATTKSWLGQVQGSGHSNNHHWNNGKTSANVGGKTIGVQQLADAAYSDAREYEEGFQTHRWMGMDNKMMEHLLKEGPGLIFQNADSMCTSMCKNWGENKDFGSGALMNITCAKGAKALDAFASGSFNAKTTDSEGHFLYKKYGDEMEVTTLMGQRFVVLGIKKGNPSSSTGITLDVLMLPPHEGYVAELGKMAAMGKSMVLLFISKAKDLLK